MARVTVADVKAIMFLDSRVTDAAIGVFITQANILVDRVFAEDTTLADATLTEIERLIAAHFIHALDPRVKAEGTDGTTAQYSGQWGMQLSATTYGQNAMMLDSTGLLAKASDNRKKASIATMDFSYS